MMLVALIMRPWVILMRTVPNVKAYILADDVLILAAGPNMVSNAAEAIDKTHAYLHQMGAKVPQTKATTLPAPPKLGNGCKTPGGRA